MLQYNIPYFSMQSMLQSNGSVIPPFPHVPASPAVNPFINSGIFQNHNDTTHHLTATSSTNTNCLTNIHECYHHLLPNRMLPLNDENEGLYPVVIGEQILSPSTRYEVLSFLGRGTFGQVLKCHSYKNGYVAMKVLKSQPKFYRQGLVEVCILQLLNRENIDAFNIVRTVEWFQHQNHICLVFEHLYQNLFDYTKDNKYAPLPLNHVRIIAHQVLTALSKLKQMGIIHADLKPENIMLISKPNDERENSDVPMLVKVIDFGSACLRHQAVQNTYLQSRYYRSPEVLLGMPFNEAIDMWSLGCICAELFLGYPIYPGQTEFEQVCYIIEAQGFPPLHLLRQSCRLNDFFVKNSDGSYRLKSRFSYTEETGIPCIEARVFLFPSLRCIEDIPLIKTGLVAPNPTTAILQSEFREYSNPEDIQILADAFDRREFSNFLCQLMHLDPSIRFAPDVALEHSFINMSHMVGFSGICPSVRNGFNMRRSLLRYYYNLSMNQRMDCVPYSTLLPLHVNVMSPDRDMMCHGEPLDMEPSRLIPTGNNFHAPMQPLYDQNWAVCPVMMTGQPVSVNDCTLTCLTLNSGYQEINAHVIQERKNASCESLLSLLQQQCSSLASSFTVDNKPNLNEDCDLWPPPMLNSVPTLLPNRESLNQTLLYQDDVYQNANPQNKLTNNILQPSQYGGDDFPQSIHVVDSYYDVEDLIYRNPLLNMPDAPVDVISGEFGLSFDFLSPTKADQVQQCNNPKSDYINGLKNEKHAHMGQLLPEHSVPKYCYNIQNQHKISSSTAKANDLAYRDAILAPHPSDESLLPNNCQHPLGAVGEKIVHKELLNPSENSITATTGMLGLPWDFSSPIKSANLNSSSSGDTYSNCLSRDHRLQVSALFSEPPIPIQVPQASSNALLQTKTSSPVPKPSQQGARTHCSIPWWRT